MGILFIPAERKIKGPWLLETDNLEKLDKVIENINEKLNQAISSEIEKNPDSKHLFSENNYKKEVVIISDKGKKIIDQTILGILRDQKTNDIKPKTLKIEIGRRYSKYSFLLSVSTNFDGELEYIVECEDDQIKDEIKYEIEKWIEIFIPNKVCQFWSNVFPFILFPVSIIWILMLLSSLIKTPDTQYDQKIKAEANSLIENGINDNNQSKAIELLLMLETKYVPDKNDEFKTSLNNRILKIFSISLVCFLILAIYPKTTIGIGKHKNKIKFYKIWKNFVLITIPSIILLPKLIEILNELIFK